MTVTIGLAFLAGLASFLSPCVFCLVPAYIGYLGGRSTASINQQSLTKRLNIFMHGFVFVIGFSIIFIFLGVAVSIFGSLLYDLRIWLTKIGGIIVILFGLHMAGLIRLSILENDLRPKSSSDIKRSYLSSLLMGIFFSAGWSPCVGPVLSSILTFAMTEGSILYGIKLLTAYSAGLAIPFLMAAFGIGWVTFLLSRFGKFLHFIEIIMGILLIIVGLMLFLGLFEQMAHLGSFIDFGM